MKTLSHDELKSLTEWEQGPCVSIYLPRHQAVSEHGEDPIHLRNLLDEAEISLQAQGLGAVETRTLLEPARKIQNDATFWERGPAQGLCILVAPGMFHQYDLAYQCPQSLSVADSFYVNPLFYKVYDNDHFDLLAICPKSVRLFRHQNGEFTQLELPENVPANLEEISANTQFEESLQYHTTSAAGARGDNASMQHGHGLTKEQNEKLLSDYFQLLAKQLEKNLDNAGPPMILVTAEKQQNLFRKHYHAKNLIAEGITTSPDHLNEQELYQLALPVIEQISSAPFRKAREQYQQHLGTSRISHQLEEILQAADQGRIEALFTPLGSELWGRLPNDGDLIQTHAQPENGDVALLNWAIRNTYKHGGTPYVISASEMPEDKPVTAYFRW
ncbi:hypothetical protein Enr10x_39010 [Gimesia panareensis]|uniref:Uncharacterized protein n=1 Tax=Gimesia panareensis TaxID=2527978 RepID=A0A517QAA3_9PLAN|nr:hypothetical protein [Gimesia panareensis]QDT28557.1 hypothetical protein Enr10x_39010 [Gimesia panareensis]